MVVAREAPTVVVEVDFVIPLVVVCDELDEAVVDAFVDWLEVGVVVLVPEMVVVVVLAVKVFDLGVVEVDVLDFVVVFVGLSAITFNTDQRNPKTGDVTLNISSTSSHLATRYISQMIAQYVSKRARIRHRRNKRTKGTSNPP